MSASGMILLHVIKTLNCLLPQNMVTCFLREVLRELQEFKHYLSPERYSDQPQLTGYR